MLLVQCPGCLSAATIDCRCPDGHTAATGAHRDDCPLANIGTSVSCGCCPQDHDHDAAANACPGGHTDPCPEPARCRLWDGVTANSRHPDNAGDPGPGDCPGGHCHKDVPGCAVCRPLVITMLPGGTALQPVFSIPQEG